MALTDCEKCWETPCCCGHEYKSFPKAKLKSVTHAALSVAVSKKIVEPTDTVMEALRKMRT